MQRLKKIFLALTRAERVVFITAGAAALVSFVVVMQILVAQATLVVPAAGGEYAEGMVGQPEYVNPVTAADETDLSLVKMIYGNVYDMADQVATSSDGRTWTVRLKEGLRWQDGGKLTSDDVIFTVQSIQNPDAASPLAPSWQGVAATRASELELRFTLANPYAFFADNLKNLYILPKHIFADVPPGNWRLSDYNLKPIGSGPYEFLSYDRRSDGIISAYRLQAWNDYSGAKPLISRFDFLFFGNTDGLVKNFNTGGIDAMGGLTAGDLAGIGRPYDLFAWRTPAYYAVFLNESKNIALQDDAVREALSVSIDRGSFVGNILAGHGKPSYGPIPEDAPYFIPTTETSSLDSASTTLARAGWVISPDGFRAKTIQKTSVPLTVNLTVPDIDFLNATARALADVWKKIGVRVNVVTVSPQDVVTDAVKNRDYEALLFGNVLGPSSDLYAFWDSSERFAPGLNLSIYQNKKVDQFVEAARQELDSGARMQDFAKAETLIAADHPAVFLYSPDYLYVTNKGVQGIKPGFIPDQSERFREAGTWYLNTARVLK